MVRQKLRGFVGQGVDGRKRNDRPPRMVILPVFATSGSGVVFAPTKCVALIAAWGAGGSGANQVLLGTAGGGGGGGFLAKRVRLAKGQSISFSVGLPGLGVPTDTDGNNGGATTVTLPSGVVLTAGGGAKGTSTGGGLGGTSQNGDVNRAGGLGGGVGGNQSGETPAFGGLGGTGSSGCGGGGGAAGFVDSDQSFIGGAGTSGASSGGFSGPGSIPGGGSGGSTTTMFTSGQGGQGRVVIVLIAYQ